MGPYEEGDKNLLTKKDININVQWMQFPNL